MKGAERISTAVLAMLAWTGVLLQFWLSIRIGMANGKGAAWGITAYFGYFTILTNVFVALAATLPLASPGSRAGRWFGRHAVRGCAVTAIAGVGIAYHILLRHVWNPQGLQWIADMVLHYLVPIGSLVWWTAFPPERVSWKWPLVWCLWPLVYFAYAMLRGHLLRWYPYYFIDVGKLGWREVLVNAAGLAVFFPILGCAVTALAVAGAKINRRP